MPKASAENLMETFLKEPCAMLRFSMHKKNKIKEKNWHSHQTHDKHSTNKKGLLHLIVLLKGGPTASCSTQSNSNLLVPLTTSVLVGRHGYLHIAHFQACLQFADQIRNSEMCPS